jgi:hypothetical protein
LLLGGVAVRELSVNLNGLFRPSQGNTPGVGSTVGAAGGALEHPLGYLGYLWQLFLPRLSFMAPHFDSSQLPAFVIFVERGWGAFGWYDVLFPHWVFLVIAAVMLLTLLLGVLAARREWNAVRSHAFELAVLVLTPIAVVAGFEAAFYTTGMRPFIAEFGRYAFPAIAPLAVLAAASLYAFPRRWVPLAGTAVLVGMIGLSYASQLLTLTGFYA